MNYEQEMTLEICTGTACYVLGGADLLELDEELRDRYPRLELKASNCLGLCTGGSGKAPFIKVNGRVYSAVETRNIWDILEGEGISHES